MVCEEECGCNKKFDRVDKFEKHLQNCLIMQDRDRGTSDDKQKHMQILGLKKYLNSLALEDLNQQLVKSVNSYSGGVSSQKYGRRERGTEFSSSSETSTARNVNRKRSMEKGIPTSLSLPPLGHN